MKSKTKVVIVVVAFVIVLLGLSYPFSPSSCNGNDCFVVGPFSGPSSGGTSGSPGGGANQPQAATISVVFPGSITYSDGSVQNISSSQSVLSTVLGPNGKPIQTMKTAVQLSVTTPTATSLKYTGYVDEDIVTPAPSGSGSSTGGQPVKTVSHNIVGQSVSIPVGTTMISLVSYNHPVADLLGFAPPVPTGGTQPATVTFNYNLAGTMNFTLYAPFNKSVSSIFAWPNVQVSVTNAGSTTGGGTAPPGGSGGSGGCGPPTFKCAISILGPVSNGVKSQWFVLGTFPVFSVVSTGSGKSVLQQLGIVH